MMTRVSHATAASRPLPLLLQSCGALSQRRASHSLGRCRSSRERPGNTGLLPHCQRPAARASATAAAATDSSSGGRTLASGGDRSAWLYHPPECEVTVAHAATAGINHTTSTSANRQASAINEADEYYNLADFAADESFTPETGSWIVFVTTADLPHEWEHVKRLYDSGRLSGVTSMKCSAGATGGGNSCAGGGSGWPSPSSSSPLPAVKTPVAGEERDGMAASPAGPQSPPGTDETGVIVLKVEDADNVVHVMAVGHRILRELREALLRYAAASSRLKPYLYFKPDAPAAVVRQRGRNWLYRLPIE
ncbi:hypothetical protein GPECTOR_8g362 [Gonium pectorale]|uniref:Uncharacterized protein n=1 Tax=Gonium pectorale TaxID=33097 RepID=A0A150GTE6_GONPE|nr:hypothetical protein GPECTOR_8g362 [Gonium pectorale]|eukprot:KXZ52992.1 hypothetical protein GPECTOR_8g362 [Gonium pectorale]